MKAYSAVQPQFIDSSEGKLFVNCNAVERTITGEEGQPDRTEFVYDSIEVADLDRSTLIAGVMQARYSKDHEIALLNAHLLGTKQEEWDAYQAYRTTSKAFVDANLTK